MQQGEYMANEIKDQQEREELKKQMVKLREQGDYQSAFAGFEQILDWDLANENHRGAVDVLGHTRIAWTNYAGTEKDPEIKNKHLDEAAIAHEKAVDLLRDHFQADKGLSAIVYAHGADLAIERMRLNPALISTDLLDETLAQVAYALEFLGGSEAHKAWVYNKYAQLMVLSGDIVGAIEAINEGKIAIFDGYEDEMENADGLMKIRVWDTGLDLTFAVLCIQQGRPELARLKLEGVLAIKDTEGYLNARKAQAQQLLDSITE